MQEVTHSNNVDPAGALVQDTRIRPVTGPPGSSLQALTKIRQFNLNCLHPVVYTPLAKEKKKCFTEIWGV